MQSTGPGKRPLGGVSQTPYVGDVKSMIAWQDRVGVAEDMQGPVSWDKEQCWQQPKPPAVSLRSLNRSGRLSRMRRYPLNPLLFFDYYRILHTGSEVVALTGSLLGADQKSPGQICLHGRNDFRYGVEIQTVSQYLCYGGMSSSGGVSGYTKCGINAFKETRAGRSLKR